MNMFNVCMYCVNKTQYTRISETFIALSLNSTAVCEYTIHCSTKCKNTIIAKS